MTMFSKLTTTGLEETQDHLGGGTQPLESNIYSGVIKAAYGGKSSEGALSVTLIISLEEREYTETCYVTNRKGENFFLNKIDPTKKVPLPGFTLIEDICLTTSGKSLSQQDIEDKVINVYDFDAKKELPKSVPMLMDLLGQPIAVGIIKQTVNKRTKVGNEYVETKDTKEENVLDKVFHPELKLTVAEARKGDVVPKFWDAWLEKNQGVTKDKTKKIEKKPVATPSTAAPRKSLFGNK